MRTKLATLLALLILTAAGACGDDDNGDSGDGAGSGGDAAAGATLTKDEFIERGDAICAELDVATELVPTPEDEAAFGPYLRAVLEPAEAAYDGFERLNPPPDGEEVYEALLQQLGSAIETVEGAAVAAESGDTVTASDLLAQADADSEIVDAQAQAYGFEECGDDDVDEEGADDPGMTEDTQP